VTVRKKPIVKKPKTAVRRNKDIGKQFEGEMQQYFINYLNKLGVKGVVFRYPEGRSFNQIVDIFIDSAEFVFACCECKSIGNTSEDGGKLYFSKLGNISKKNNKHQFINQHTFLFETSRFGMMAFKFRDIKKVIIVPHQMVYQKVADGNLYITVDEIIKSGFDIDDKKASLKLFIKKCCRTVE
jgi:hypothetical protein